MSMFKMNARGFSLIETGAMMAIVSLIGMVVGPAVVESRSQMRRATSTANLMQMGQSAAVYGFSNQGRLFSYSWRAGEAYLMPNGRVYTSNDDQQAAARQNEEILQRTTGRISGQTKIQSFQTRLPHRRYNHLVLIDFMGEGLSSSKYIDPADRQQLYWAAHPLEYLLDFQEGSTLPYVYDDLPSGYDQDPNWGTNPVRQRWTFATSYQSVPAAWQPDYPNPQYAPVQDTPHLFTVEGAVSGNQLDLHTGRNFFELAHPSQKVWLHEEFDRGTLQKASSPGDYHRVVPQQSFYFAYDFARPEKLMFDLSVNGWASGDANSSRVEHLDEFEVWRQSYVPLHRFPLPIGGLGDDTELDMRYRWTYQGLKGVDYGATDP